MTLTNRTARSVLKNNENVSIKYHKMIDDAELYLENNLQILTEDEEIEARKCSVADYIREVMPKYKDWSDEDIIKRFDELNKKYEEGK